MLITGCSWGRWAATGSIKVDENYPSQLWGSFLFVGLLFGWGLMVLGWWRLLETPPAAPRRLAYGGLLVASLMLPMLSNDVFSLMTYGSVAASGWDVYTTASTLPGDPFYAFLGERWHAKVCVYGPTTLVATLPVALAHHSAGTALGILRLVWLAPLAGVMELSFRRLGDRPFFHAMVWLNPLFLVEGLGQLHADVLGLGAIVAGIALTVAQPPKRLAGWLFYAVAVLGKYSFVFAGLWFWLHGTRTWRDRLLRLLAMAAVLVVVGALVYAPFWRGPATLTAPLHALSTMNPGGSITEVGGILVDLVRGGAIPRADTPVTESLAIERAAHETTWRAVSLVFQLVAVVVGIRVLRDMLRRPHDDDRIALGTGALVVALITLASPRFQSWYLMAALPFFGLRCTAVWRRWWLAAVALSVSTELVHVLARTSPILPVASALTNGGVVVVFLMSFRDRYFPAADAAPPGATATAAP